MISIEVLPWKVLARSAVFDRRTPGQAVMGGGRVRCARCSWPTQGSSRFDKVATRSYLCEMRSVGVKVLKNKLSEYLRLATSGETVLVTDRDRVVAELIPPREGRSVPVADAFLAEAVRQGWLTAPALRADRPPPRLPVASAAKLLAELAADRADR